MPDIPTEPTDRTLLAGLRAGQNEAATSLYLKYAERLKALATRQMGADLKSRVDPEDVVQSVFRTFFRRAAKGEYTVPAGEELWKLFLVIGLNKVRTTGNYHHAACRDTRKTAGGAAIDEGVAQNADGDGEALSLLQLTIDDTLSKLPKSNRAMVMMRIEGHEVDEIAERVGRAKRSVERVLRQFRDRLQRDLGEFGEPDEPDGEATDGRD